jgi:hypothetical protein
MAWRSQGAPFLIRTGVPGLHLSYWTLSGVINAGYFLPYHLISTVCRSSRGEPFGLLAGLLLALALPAGAETPTLAAAAAPVAPVTRETTVQKAVAQRVDALIGYTRWPATPDPYRLCIVGDARRTTLLQAQDREAQGHRLVARTFEESAAPTADCDVLYLGAMARPVREAILAQWAGKAVLTIGEDEECAGALMFCLAVRGDAVSMRANLDSIARAGVKVNANVLNLFGRRRPPE